MAKAGVKMAARSRQPRVRATHVYKGLAISINLGIMMKALGGVGPEDGLDVAGHEWRAGLWRR